MGIDFATTLHVRDRRTDGPASLVDIATIVGDWARVPDPEALVESGTLTDVGDRRAVLRTEKLDLGAGDAWAWRMRLSHLDDRDPSVSWVVELATVEDPRSGDTPVSVTLARESRDRRVRAVRTDRPAPPRLIRDIVDHPRLECLDGPIPLATSHNVLGTRGIEGFAQQVLLIKGRSLPVIGVSVRPVNGETLVDPKTVARLLSGMAHVWVIAPDTTWALSEQLPAGLGVYNGAVRVWWPGLDAASRRFDHDLWRPETSEHPQAELIATVVESALARFGPLEELEGLRTTIRERERAEMFAELERLRARSAEVAAGDGDEVAKGDSLALAIRTITEERDYAFEDNARLEAELAISSSALLEAQRERRALRTENDVLKEHLRRAGGVPEADEAGSDARQAFLDEVRQEYRARLTDVDREAWPLKPMSVHPNFLASLHELHGIARDKVIAVCAEVACGRAPKVAGRAVHSLRTSKAGNAKQRVRNRDRAKAMRCALQQKTSSARRLHYWELPGGGIEFAHVGLHDDERCPE